MPDDEFRFRPPDRRDMWRQLSLTMSQAAALTGVSERQIQHWMDQGYILPATRRTRKVNGDGLDKIALIKQARGAGISLRRAVSLADEYLLMRASDGLETEVAPGALRDLEKRLKSLRSGIEAVEHLLQSVGPDGTGGSTGRVLRRPADHV